VSASDGHMLDAGRKKGKEDAEAKERSRINESPKIEFYRTSWKEKLDWALRQARAEVPAALLATTGGL